MWLTSPQHSALPMLLVGRVQTGREHWHKGSLAWRTETWPSSHILSISGDKTQQVFIFNKEESNSLQSWSLSPEAVEIGEDSMMKASFVECFPSPSRNWRLGEREEDGPSPHPERSHQESELSGRLHEANTSQRNELRKETEGMIISSSFQWQSHDDPFEGKISLYHSDQHSLLAKKAAQFFQCGYWTYGKAHSDTRQVGTLDSKA